MTARNHQSRWNRANYYTQDQAAQMAADTSFTSATYTDEFGGAEERDYAIVAAPQVTESHGRFYMDREWRSWMSDTHPEWSVEEMSDVADPALSWRVWIVRVIA